jgi:tetratricopeptide (TPR) repeat protein
MIAIVIWQSIIRAKGPSPPIADRPSVAIMYFKNNTGDQSLDYLSETLTSLLTYDLGQSTHLKVLPNDRLIQIVNKFNMSKKGNYSTDELEKVAEWGVVDHIIQGDYFKAGDDFRISLQIQKAGSWEVLGIETLSSQLDHHTRMVDELTPKIKSYFGLSEEDIEGDIDLDIGQITTRSAEAFTHYYEGVKHWASSRNSEALESFKKAVDIDPQFAMAHFFLAGRYRSQLLHPQAKEHLAKALSLSSHLTDREKYFVEAEALKYGLSGDKKNVFIRLEESYKKILELYPDDWLANYEMGNIYIEKQEWEKAREFFLKNKQNKVDFVRNYTGLGKTYKSEGLYDDAIETYKYYIESFSDSPSIRDDLAHAYLCIGQLDVALEEENKAHAQTRASGGNWLRGVILMCMEDWLKAEEEFQNLIREGKRYAPLVGFEGMGHLLRTQGKLKESIEFYEQGLREAINQKYVDYEFFFLHHLTYVYFQNKDLKEALNKSDMALKVAQKQMSVGRQARCLFQKGYIYLGMDSIEDAQSIAGELKNLFDNRPDDKSVRYYHLLIGLIESKKNNIEEAENYLLQALSTLPFPGEYAQRWDDHAVFFDALAMTYFKLGELDKAQKQYERIISLTEGRLHLGVIYAKSYYMLGRVFEQKGWNGKAIEQYERFLDLWKDADEGFSEVEDAKERLVRLSD